MEEKNNEIRLFKNKYKKEDRHPSLTGSGMVDNKKVKVSAWTNTTKSGDKWIKISVREDDGEAYSGGGGNSMPS